MFIDRLDEEFLLFALGKDGQLAETRKGSVDSGMAGAWLAEMVLHNRVRFEHDKVVHRTHSEFGEPVLDDLLKTVWKVRRPRRVRSWVGTFARQAPRRTEEILQRLAERGYLEQVGKGRRRRYMVHGDGRSLLRGQLLEILQGRREPDEPTVALIALLDAAGLLGHVFGSADAGALHNQSQLLLRRYHSLAVIAEEVRGRQGWSLFRWRRKAPAYEGPKLKVKGRTVKQEKPLSANPVRFDPRSGGRRPL